MAYYTNTDAVGVVFKTRCQTELLLARKWVRKSELTVHVDDASRLLPAAQLLRRSSPCGAPALQVVGGDEAVQAAPLQRRSRASRAPWCDCRRADAHLCAARLPAKLLQLVDR